MNRNLLKSLLVAGLLVAGGSGVMAEGTWSTIYSEDYDDPSSFNVDGYWASAITDRYVVQQTPRDGGGYALEVAAVGNGSNGTTASYTGLTAANAAVARYLDSDQYRVSFEFNFCYNNSQNPSFLVKDTDGNEIVGFYSLSSSSGAASMRLNANGSADGGKELSAFTLDYRVQTPATYNKAVFYTSEGKTKMDITWAGGTETYTYDVSDKVIHIGNLVYNTARYYGHFVFDNLKVELYADEEIVSVPQSRVVSINGKSRTIELTTENDSHEIFYYIGDGDSNPQKYTGPIVLSESCALHYYAQSESGARSDVAQIDVNCVDVKLAAPTINRTGADSYVLTASQAETDGITPVPTIHYTIGGGEELTVENGGEIFGVDGDIEAWAVADGFTESDKTTATYVAPYLTTDVWAYDLNAFPSEYGVTSISDAVDLETAATLNGVTVYNLNGIDCPDLYVENSSAWLLRNQDRNAFKIQNSSTTLTFDNVTPANVIYINGVDDNGRYRISEVINGEVAYCYDNSEYFIVPAAAGAVTVRFNTGVSVNVVAVKLINENVTIASETGFATYTPKVDLDFTNARNIAAYTATVSGDVVNLAKVNMVAAGEGVLIYSANGAGSENVPAAGEQVSKVAGNMFVGTLVDIEELPSVGGQYANYILNDGTLGVGFYKANNKKVGAGKAYLRIPVENSAKMSFLSLGGGSATDISAIKDGNERMDNEFYNLNGQRVASPSKGLYILNGKKIIVK